MAEPRQKIAAVVEGMRTHNDRQATIKEAIKILAESSSTGDEFKTEFVELLPPEYLLHSDVVTHTVLFKHLRSLLDAINMRVERRAGLMIAQAIAEIIYSNDMLQVARNDIAASR